jgi:hypothetical protein
MADETDGTRKPVTANALVRRINRALAHEGQCGRVLKKTRGYYWWLDLGDYFVLDRSTNAVLDKFVDIEERGRRLGVLTPRETLHGGAQMEQALAR